MGWAALIGFGISAIQGKQGYDQESAQADLDESARKENNKQVTNSLLTKYQSLESKSSQADEAFIANDLERQKMKAQSRGIALAAQGASGTGGTGADMQLLDVDVNSSMSLARSQINLERERAAIRSEGSAATQAANANINRMPTQQPSAGAAVLGAGMNGFRNMTALQGASDSYGQAKQGTRIVDEVDTGSLYDVNPNQGGNNYRDPNYTRIA